MSNLVEHARREIAALESSMTEEDEMQSEVNQTLIKAVEAIASYQGHSGGSIMWTIEALERLLRFQNLAPLTDNPEEWVSHGVVDGHPNGLWQSSRRASAFSDDGGKTYHDVYEDECVEDVWPKHETVHVDL